MNKFNELHNDLSVVYALLKGVGSSTSYDLKIKLTWLEKYFLIRVLHIYGFDILISEPMDNLVPTLGISYMNINQSFIALEQNDILSFENVSEGPGRPTRSFKVNSDCLIDALGVELDIQSNTHHTALIDSLLCWGEQNDEACLDLGQGADTRSRRAYLKDKNHKLYGQSRFFIAMLLAHADEFGFVESLGHADFEALTGLGSDQQQRLVKKLKKSGYIRSITHGLTNPKIFGPVHTVYCLNTHSAEISGLEPIALTVFSETMLRVVHENSESTQLNKIANHNQTKKKRFEENEWVEIRSFINDADGYKRIKPEQTRLLKGVKDKPFYTYLQYRLESYACWFLSVPEYKGSSSAICKQEGQNIRQRIQADVSTCSDAEKVTDDEKDFSNVLYEIAKAMADTYYQFLNKYHNESLTGSDRVFRILPRELRATLGFAIVNRTNYSGQDLTPCIHIKGHHTDINIAPMKITVCDESQLDDEIKIRCGLAS